MIPVPSRLVDPVAAASGDNTLYTPPEGHRAQLQTITLVNTGTSKVTVKMGINATSAGAQIFPAVGVPGNGMVERESHRYLTEFDSLMLNCTATGITVTVDGLDFYPRL